MSFHIRYAERADTALILAFIKGLAAYEKLSNEVVADEATLAEWLFDKQKAEVIFAVADGKEVGFALFFHNFSSLCIYQVHEKRHFIINWNIGATVLCVAATFVDMDYLMGEGLL